MKKLLILMMFTGVLASCTRVPNCSVSIGTHAKKSKNLKAVRKTLRTRWNHHQTRVGRFFNINVL